MGCDIHLIVEVRRDGKWRRALPGDDARDPWYRDAIQKGRNEPWLRKRYDVSWYADRNYHVFAVLAGVRNYTDLAPIAEPRGLPRDLSDEGRYLAGAELLREHGLLDEAAGPWETNDDGDPIASPSNEPPPRDEDDHDIWLGDHSHSYLTVAELDAYDWQSTLHDSGWIEYQQWKAWTALPVERRGVPYPYSRGVFGQSIVHLTEREAADVQHVDSTKVYYVNAEWVIPVAEVAGRFYTEVLPALRTLGAPDDVRIVFGFDS